MSDDSTPTPPTADAGGSLPGGVSTPCCVSGITGLTIVSPCRFIPKGKTKTFEANGAPAGGNYSWTASGGISIVGGANTKTVQVRGDTTSGALDAAELQVTYRCGSHSRQASVKLTVFEITGIRVTVEATPANTVRASYAAPADHVETITSGSRDFGTNDPIVLMRCPNRGVELMAVAQPAGLPMQWHRLRNSADHASLGGAGEAHVCVVGDPCLRRQRDHRRVRCCGVQGLRLSRIAPGNGAQCGDQQHGERGSEAGKRPF